MADPITVTVSGTTALLALERLFALFVAPRIRSKEEQQAHKGETSGEKDPAYWEQKFGKIFDEKLDQRVLPILEKQSAILESLARTIEGLAVIIKRKRL